VTGLTGGLTSGEVQLLDMIFTDLSREVGAAGLNLTGPSVQL
jgi:hypothetical protein